MNKNLIKQVLADNQAEVFSFKVVKRKFAFEEFGNYVFVGARRSGKSYLLYQRMQQLIEKGKTFKDILYVNFEDERLVGMQAGDLNLLLEAHLEMGGEKPILFLDEIQNINGWEKFARRLADTKHRVYITGSNAKMLSAEIQTTLGGRYISVETYPYNFNEFLTANKTDFSENALLTTKGRAGVLKKFEEYFYFGGFPESALLKSKRDYLTSVYQKIYLGDIAARHSVENIFALRVLFKKIAESIKQPLSFNRIANIVSSTGAKIGINTVINYIDYAKEAWLISSIQNFAGKISDKETNPKYYFVDNGLLNLLLIDKNTSLLENLIAVNLLRKYGRDNAVYFYNKNFEVDFYVPETGIAIQACYSIESNETFERELNALLKMSKILKCKKLLIITRSDEKTLKISGRKVEIIPAWKWVMAMS